MSISRTTAGNSQATPKQLNIAEPSASWKRALACGRFAARRLAGVRPPVLGRQYSHFTFSVSCSQVSYVTRRPFIYAEAAFSARHLNRSRFSDSDSPQFAKLYKTNTTANNSVQTPSLTIEQVFYRMKYRTQDHCMIDFPNPFPGFFSQHLCILCHLRN